jgi:thiol-disulfide isomerase/thioredoxin
MNASIVRWGALAGLSLAAAVGRLDAGTVPRYELKSGQMLTYEQDQTFKGESPTTGYKTIWTLWVVGQNNDGSWRIVARTASKSRKADGAPMGEERKAYARFDLRPDGEVPRCPTLDAHLDPTQIFPRLPGDEKALAAGWESHDETDDATIRYKKAGAHDESDAATFDFDADSRTFVERIYEGKDVRNFHFDRKRGVIARSELVRNYGAHMKSEGKGVLELTSIAQMTPAELESFRADWDRFFDVQPAFHQLAFKAETHGHEAEALQKQARALLADARDKVKLPEPAAALDEQIKNHDRFAKSQVEGAKRFAALIGKKAPAWEIKDLEGQTHTLDQYKGKVLVLDFWYRGCGWCMRAMPQVKRVAAHYRGRPVAVFGMNNDREENDAKFVAREMQLEYPVLRSEDLPAKYAVQGFPTLIIVDQQGNIADIHVGYSPELYAQVTAVVDQLLAK